MVAGNNVDIAKSLHILGVTLDSTLSLDHYVAAKATYIRLLHGKIGFLGFSPS